jgi:hypothetical protein
MSQIARQLRLLAMTTWVVAVASGAGYADVVTEWNATTNQIVVGAVSTPLEANRILAIVQTSVYEAANAISRRYPASDLGLEAPEGASLDAAVAAANRVALHELVPGQRTAIDSTYNAALQKIADGNSKANGIAVGEKAAHAILALRNEAGSPGEESYRPLTIAGAYVPTVIPVGVQEAHRRPWLMAAPWQFRPGPPPSLTSEIWSRDFNEIKRLGSKNGSIRTATQDAMARFWEATMPPIYHGLVRSAVSGPGRDPTQNALLFAKVTQAVDDALIAIMDAKYHYTFWRPITAIRNGDLDNNEATERDSCWTPLINTPMHPEYPCAHCIVSATIGTLLRSEFAGSKMPRLTTTSPTAGGVSRSWESVDDFISEVGNARIYDGVHYRNSTEVGTAMGKQIGELYIGHFPKRYSATATK